MPNLHEFQLNFACNLYVSFTLGTFTQVLIYNYNFSQWMHVHCCLNEIFIKSDVKFCSGEIHLNVLTCINFTWITSSLCITIVVHPKSTLNLYKVTLMWNSCENYVNFTWVNFHVKFIWIFSREFHVNHLSDEIHVNFSCEFHVSHFSRTWNSSEWFTWNSDE
jgi:hypothetical protein